MGPVNRPLDLDWLEDFLVLCEEGNFSRAAQARNIAQPAFSRHIRALEEWVGVELVDRTRHPASPTPAGALIQACAQDVVGRLSQARTLANEAHGQAARSLRFAATHVLSLAFFPEWLQRIEQQMDGPLGPIVMTTDSFQACEEMLLQRRVQFLLCYGDAAVPTRLVAPEFEFASVGSDRLLPVSAVDGQRRALHAVAADADAPVATGSESPVALLAYNDESWLGRIMRARMPEVFDSARFRAVVTSHHTGLLKNLALQGRGVAWLPRSLVAAELAMGTLVLADGRPDADEAGEWRMPVDIHLYRAAADPTAIAEAVWQRATRRLGD